MGERAQMTLEQLRNAWGRIVIRDGTPEYPQRIERHTMGRIEFWIRTGGGAGKNALFERVE